jgi:hypothetical protein
VKVSILLFVDTLDWDARAEKCIEEEVRAGFADWDKSVVEAKKNLGLHRVHFAGLKTWLVQTFLTISENNMDYLMGLEL